MTARAARHRLARGLVVLAALCAVLALSGPAGAHVGGGAAGSNWDAAVTAAPDVPGVSVRVLSFGDEIEVVAAGDTEVQVPGYSDEPYLRIGPDGVWRNRNSPATWLNLDRYAQAAADGLPDHVDAEAAPDWERVSAEAAYLWHDHRTHWMSEDLLPPAVAAAPDRVHTVAEWSVPLVVDGAAVAVEGVLTWEPPPPPWTVWPAYVAVALLAVAAGLVAPGPRPLAVLLAVGAAAAVWHALATPAPPASLGSHAGALVSALLPASVTVAVAGLGGWAAVRGRGAMTGLLAVVLGWLLLVQGLSDVDVLWTANVLAAGPEWAARAAVAVLVALGSGLVAGGLVAVRRFREPELVAG